MPTSPLLIQLGRTYERHGHRLPPLASLLLLVLIANLVARLIWLLVPEPETARWQAPAAVVSRQAVPAADPALAADAHLFGEYQPEPGDAATAPETRLSLILLGILADSHDTESRALIASSDGQEKPYAIGDDVIKGVSLKAIFADRVVLARDGQLETLRLQKDAPMSGAARPLPPASSVNSATTAMLNQIRDEVLTDPSKASQYIRVQPANVNGQLRGFRVYPGRKREAFGELGLRPGDLVTAINGIQLDDSQKALQMLTELSQAGSVSVTVDRGGKTQTINVTFN